MTMTTKTKTYATKAFDVVITDMFQHAHNTPWVMRYDPVSYADRTWDMCFLGRDMSVIDNLHVGQAVKIQIVDGIICKLLQ